MYTCALGKNGIDFSVYAEEVNYNTTIKVSITWEINSRDIAYCRAGDNNDLLDTIIGRNILPNKIEVGVLLNLEEMKDVGFDEKDIVKVKQLIKGYPNSISWTEHYEKDENEEKTDGFPIKVEVVWEKDGENWVKAIEDWNRELDLEYMNFLDVIKIEHEQFNIEVSGEVVNVNELMSMVDERHDTFSPLDWVCVYPLPLDRTHVLPEHTHAQLLVE